MIEGKVALSLGARTKPELRKEPFRCVRAQTSALGAGRNYYWDFKCRSQEADCDCDDPLSKFKSLILLLTGIFTLRQNVPKLCCLSAIQAWLTFTNDFDHT